MIRGGKELGKRCTEIMRHWLAPNAWEATTNSRSVQGQHRAARNAGIVGDAHDGYSQHGMLQAGTQRGDDGNRQQDCRESHQNVDQAHDSIIHPATQETGQQPDQGADGHSDEHG